MTGEIVRWGDAAQYEAAPIKKDELGRITPQVHLLWATPDPLGAIAAVCRQFKGIPTYDLSEITDDERREYWEESFKSHLRAPHEFVQFHFQVEAVTRSFTHQMVRQRTATFGQESLRFAVKDNLAQEIALPPSIVDGSNAASVWETCIKGIETAYNALVNAGIPAEDARGLLPHATTTRLHWRTNLNDLLHHAGNRLCTQAQFEWRFVMIGVIKAIKNYDSRELFDLSQADEPWTELNWQFELMARPTARTFAPICYHTGKCEFKAIFDRPCSIRDRVEAFGRAGIPSDDWGVDTVDNSDNYLTGIKVEEWLLDHTAARGDH